MKEVWNISHIKNVTHIDLKSSTLVCPNDYQYYRSSGAQLVPIFNYAN